MDRRFLSYLLLTTALFFLWMNINRQQLNQPDLEKERAKEQALATESSDPLLRAERQLPTVPEMKSTPTASDKPEVESSEATEPDPEAQSIPRPSYPLQKFTLGSMASDSKYRLMVVLTSQGAAVERAELVERDAKGRFRFKALENEGGYLGYLGMELSDSGALVVHSVPPGSPAALAKSADGVGLQPGDTLLELNRISLTSRDTFQSLLRAARDGDEVELLVDRPSQGQLRFKALLGSAPLDVLRTDPVPSEQVSGNRSRPSLRTTIASLNSFPIPPGKEVLTAIESTLTGNWEARKIEVEGGDGVEFRLPLESYLQQTGRPAKLTLVKRYRLFPPQEGVAGQDGYILDLETEVINENDVPVNVAMRQEGPAGLTLEGWWYSVKISPGFRAAGHRDVIYANGNPNSHTLLTTREIIAKAQKTPLQPDAMFLSENESLETRSLSYVGLDSPYFTAAVVPKPDAPNALAGLYRAGAVALADLDELAKAQQQATNTSFYFDTASVEVLPQTSAKQEYQVFIGPKDPQFLAEHGLERAIEYGWFPLVAKPLSAILHFFYGIVQNYGLAIVLLTLMVRGLMFPLGRNAAVNAQKMQELQPALKQINEKYKDDLQKRAKATQDLYAKHNFKPLAGCLPLFIQLPIFIGLYRCLSVDISLRQAALIPGVSWCSNLAAPDQLYDWSSWMPEFFSGRGTGWLGPYFNVLPLVTVVLFLVQQKMLMPKATDEQTRMTQNIMQIMTVFMGVMFFKVPAGLCIYFITSSLWSLVERKLVKRLTPPTKIDPNAPVVEESSSPSSRKRKPEAPKPAGKLAELKQLLDKGAVKSATQRGSTKQRKKGKN